MGGFCLGEWYSVESHVSGVQRTEEVRRAILCCRLFRVSAASMSSADIPERTLAARVERLCSDLIMSMSMAAGFVMSDEVRIAERGGEKGGGRV